MRAIKHFAVRVLLTGIGLILGFVVLGPFAYGLKKACDHNPITCKD